MTRMKTIAGAEGSCARRGPRVWNAWRRALVAVIAAVVLCAPGTAQTPPLTGPQQLEFSGLRAVASSGVPAGAIHSVAVGANGSLYLLLDLGDGVRLLKTDASGSTIQAQAQIGAKGDVGTAMALDPAGNVYVTGTTSSGALTATAGAAFLTATGTGVNSFIAKFDGNLNTYFVSFAGADSIAASGIAVTNDAVFLTGSIYSSNLPVTSSGVIQAPAYGSTGNGFVERFSASGSTLVYATYLSGAGGNTSANAIVADASDNAYVAGYTTAPGYPTVNGLLPELPGTAAGFVTKLSAAGDAIVFSTFIPGTGVSSLALDPAKSDLLLSGGISLGQFPVTALTSPPVPLTYQVLVRMPLDGSAVSAATAIAPGSTSFVAAGADGTAWVDGTLSLPLLPRTPLATIGNSFGARVDATGAVDQTVRFGGVATSNATYASAPVNLTSVAVDGAGDLLAAGQFQPTASASLLATETFDLPLENAPTAAFPTTVRGAVLPTADCNGSSCPGAAAYLAKVAPTASANAASLALSVDDAPNLTLRNLGSAQAVGLQITASGFQETDDCGGTLAGGGECSIALTGAGPGSIRVTAQNAVAQTQNVPGLTASVAPVVVSPKELDFDVVSAAGAPVTRTFTVTNFTQQPQTFSSSLSSNPRSTLPYTFAEQSTDCTLAGGTSRTLGAGSSCHITLSLTPSSDPANDGPIEAVWLVGTRPVTLTAYGQAAALSVSAAQIDFGTRYPGGPATPRFLYLSNPSSTPYTHTTVALPARSPFTVEDRCPTVLEPQSVCQIALSYQPAGVPSSDSVTLGLDQGLNVLVTGRAIPAPSALGATVNPSLSVAPATVNFDAPVVVTGSSGTGQTVTIANTGASPFALTLALSGDFADATDCPATLAGGASCTVLVSFTPSAPGTRTGLLSVTAAAGSTPAYVALTGTGTAILQPSTNGVIDLGQQPVGEPVVAWYKVTQAFTSFAASVSSTNSGTPFTVVLVEDAGYGHGSPPSSAFSSTANGTCLNCWVGVQFDPATVGTATGTLTLSSSSAGKPYALTLTGTGGALSGLLIAPTTQDFGPVPVHSTSGTAVLAVTNLVAGQSSVSLSAPALTGDFALSSATTGGPACGGTLAYGASCYLPIAYAPTAIGPATGSVSLAAGGVTASATLTGYGEADSGIALNPTTLTFANVPGASATQQIVTVENTGGSTVQVGQPLIQNPASAASFAASTNCGALAAGASCTVSVKFTPAAGPVAGSLVLPVTTSPGGAPQVTNYTVPLTGSYTSEDAGLQILPDVSQFGPVPTGSESAVRVFQVNNLTAKALTVDITLPRQYVLEGPSCAGLAPGASCSFSVAFLPLTNDAITGTIFATGAPTDGSGTVEGLSYLDGFGQGSATLTITGGLRAAGVLEFGTVPSGQSAQQTLTLTNSSSTAPLTVRRITSEWPFLSRSTCGGTLAPGAACTVTVTYTPLDQVSSAGGVPPSHEDTGTLMIESDAGSSPDVVDMQGYAGAQSVGTPSNAAPIAAFTASPSSLTFAQTQAGDASAPQSVRLSNTGTDPVHITGLQSSPDFTLTSDCGTILPGASCTITVTFTPQALAENAASGNLRASAVVISSDAVTSLEFVSVVGSATPSPLALNSTALDFGTVQVGSSGGLDLQVTNTGASAITFGNLSTTGDYSATAGSCPLAGQALPANTSCAVHIVFSPTATGTRTGTMNLSTSASTLPLRASLTGVGVQSHLQISASTLNFGPVALGSSSSLTLTLANTGSAPATGLGLTTASPYAVTVPCALTTLAPGGSCSVTVTFTPTGVGTYPGTLTIASSDSGSPATILLSGSGVNNGSFSLTVNGGSAASAAVNPYGPASYSLTVTPLGGFSGQVLLTCAGVNPGEYINCSLVPSSVTLNGAAQNAVVTLQTVSSIASAEPGPRDPDRNLGQTALALLFPALLFSWKARTSPRRAWRRTIPVLWAFFAAAVLLTSSGCGGGGPVPYLRFASPGTYQYQVTATSVGTDPEVTRTVTLNLTVTN